MLESVRERRDQSRLVEALTRLEASETGVECSLRQRHDRLQERDGHLFPIVIGQEINPRMNPRIVLYEYARSATPRYRAVLTLPVSPEIEESH